MKQTGNAYFYLLGVILVMALIAAAGWKGYSLGQTVVKAEWQKQALTESIANAAKFKELSDKYRAMEQESAVRVAAVSRKYQQELSNAKTATNTALNSLRAGTVVLRDPDAGKQACGSGNPETSPGTARSDGGTPGRLPSPPAGILSQRAGEFLINLAAEADSCALQVKGLQDIVSADRR